MQIWRTLASLAVLMLMHSAVWAQSYELTEAPQAGDCFHYQLTMSLQGEMRISREDKVVPMSLAASAMHQFAERVLIAGADRLPYKTARLYESAKAAIQVENDSSQRSLRPDRRLLIAHRLKEQPTIYSPLGLLTREELQLTSEHLDTLAITGLLPQRTVSVGDTWKAPDAVLQGLCLFEGLASHDVVCKLENVKVNVATISVAGSAAGIDVGALVKISLQAVLRFDLAQRRLVAVEWKQKDEREQGPVSPAMSIESSASLSRAKIEVPAALSDVALVKAPDGVEPPPPQLTSLYYRDPKSRFEIGYGREWHVVGETPEHLVLRLMERGDFVSQATITPWTPVKPGAHMSPDEFRQAMADTPDWEPEEEIQAGEIPLEDGHWGYRISATGKLDGLKVTQNFYLVVSPQGEQTVVAFTMSPTQVEKLGARDLSLVSSLDFPQSRKSK